MARLSLPRRGVLVAVVAFPPGELLRGALTRYCSTQSTGRSERPVGAQQTLQLNGTDCEIIEVTEFARLVAADNLLVGVHGASPEAYMAFHPGWTEAHFFTMAGLLRKLVRAGVKTRHVQVIDRNTAPDVPAMVDLGRSLGAERVNYKLASLAHGTEATAITEVQRRWLLDEAIPEARARATAQGVHTNLDLFERQVRASVDTHLRRELVRFASRRAHAANARGETIATTIEGKRRG